VALWSGGVSGNPDDPAIPHWFSQEVSQAGVPGFGQVVHLYSLARVIIACAASKELLCRSCKCLRTGDLRTIWFWRPECETRGKKLRLGAELMSEIAQQTQQEFWRPPSALMADAVVVREAIPTMAEACPRCGTEFLLGSRFCHACGGRRPEAVSATARADAAAMAGLWERVVAWVHSVVARFSPGRIWRKIRVPAWLLRLRFHQIKEWLGLPTASLIAFFIGVGCVVGALLMGLLTARNLVDWQAIQFYRAEWLLGATAAFVAGILLKRPPAN
jgi:hypothetical protein